MEGSRRSLVRDMSGLVGQHGFYAVVHSLVDVCHERSEHSMRSCGNAGWSQACRVLRRVEQLAQEFHLDSTTFA